MQSKARELRVEWVHGEECPDSLRLFTLNEAMEEQGSIVLPLQTALQISQTVRDLCDACGVVPKEEA